MADVRIASIGTAVPPVVLEQSRVRRLLTGQPGLSRVAARLVGAAVDNSAVETRRTVIAEFDDETDASAEPMFYDRAAGALLEPSTGDRNAVFARESVPLALAAARRALAGSGLRASDVTHVITVSCTGFFAPGPDFELVRALGLRADTRRLNVGFMGCHGAFPALRAAVDACRADPGSVALVVCVELCTLHLRSSEDPDVIVASSVFADGAAAAVVTGRPGAGLRVDALHSAIAPDSAADLTWVIGDTGFEMQLSSYVPRVLGAEIDAALAPLQPEAPWRAVPHWAVHPGGRAILDRVEQALALTPAQLAPSRAVLREHGNMSSPTVLFILRRVLAAARPGERTVATAFGPGLTVEAGLFTAVAA
jgi:predicted naringenin-chalcone synthase